MAIIDDIQIISLQILLFLPTSTFHYEVCNNFMTRYMSYQGLIEVIHVLYGHTLDCSFS